MRIHDGQGTHILLGSSELDNSLLDGATSNESIDGDLFRLTDSMCSVHSLGVVRGIPVVVICQGVSYWPYEDFSAEGSQKTTVSAAVKLIPRPPARVLRQKMKISGLQSVSNCLNQ
jgi:hypothetical protein